MQTGDMPWHGGSISENFDAMFLRSADYSRHEVSLAHVARGMSLEDPSCYCGVIVTGSPAMVTDREKWSEKSALWLRQAVLKRVPVLAVCYGHQLLAHALGGTVGPLPGGMELGTHQVTLEPLAQKHPLLQEMPQRFSANMAHSQTVLKAPKGAVVLGRSAHDAHQILAYGRHVLSLQFHPEFDAAAMHACVCMELDRLALLPEFRAPHLGLPVQETPEARGILGAFVRACRQ